MNAVPQERGGAAEAIAGLLASAAIFVSLLALVYRPARITPVAIVLALVAARMTTTHSRLAAFAVGTATVCWFLGMTIAVLTRNPLF